MITRAAAVLLILFGCIGPVQAYDSKFYYGLSLTANEFEAAGVDMNGLGLKLGREFTQFFSVEIHSGIAADSTNNILGDPELTYSAAFARLNLPFERVSLYVLGGAATMDFDIPGFDDIVDAGEIDRAAGFGMDLLANENTALTIEVVYYGNEDNLDEIEFLHFGYTHRFEFPGLR